MPVDARRWDAAIPNGSRGAFMEGDGSRAAAKGVRFIVVVCAAAILGASASFGEVCPFHRLPRKYRVTLILGRTALVQKTPETFG